MTTVRMVLECGADPENEGRFFAALHWNNPAGELGPTHETLKYINEISKEDAVEALLLADELPTLLVQSLVGEP